jgi:hypothetical protein
MLVNTELNTLFRANTLSEEKMRQAMIQISEMYVFKRKNLFLKLLNINAEVVTRVTSSLEAGGLPGYPKSKINVMKS